MKVFLSKLFDALKPTILKLLEKQATKSLLKYFLGSALAGGPQAWLITFLIGECFDQIEEGAELISIHLAMKGDQEKGHKIVKRMNKALVEENHEEYDNAVDDILNS